MTSAIARTHRSEVGGAWHVPLNEVEELVATGGSPEEAFDRRWARSLFDYAPTTPSNRSIHRIFTPSHE